MRSRPAAWPSASAGSTTCAPHLSVSVVIWLGIADDQLRPVSGLPQHVGAGAHADQNGLVLLDERLERLEVLGDAGFLGDDHDVAAVHVDVDVGDADAVDQQRALTADEFDGVARERFQMCHQTALGLVHQLAGFPGRCVRCRGSAGGRPEYTPPSCRRILAPSLIFLKTSGPASSISVTPLPTSTSGPRLG